MFNLRSTALPVLIVAGVSVGAAVFRVATAPERVRERREVAQKTCTGLGGVWTAVDRSGACLRPHSPPPGPDRAPR
jgi:hypothetical protein